MSTEVGVPAPTSFLKGKIPTHKGGGAEETGEKKKKKKKEKEKEKKGNTGNNYGV